MIGICTRDAKSALGHTLRGLVLAMCLTLAVVGCGGQSGDEERTKIRLVSTGSVMTLPVWVAQEQGYFEANGVDVEDEIITTKVGAQVPSLLGRQYDLGQVTGPVLISSAESGVDIVAASGGATSSAGDENTLLIVKSDSGIDSPQDLEGKRMAAPSVSGNVNTGTMYWLKSKGVDTDSVEVVAAASPNMPDLLTTGKVDAAQVSMPFAGRLLGSGYKSLKDVGLTLGDPTLMITWASDRTWAEENEQAVVGFRNAIDQASDWIDANNGGAIELLMEKTDVPDEYKPYTNLATYSSKIEVSELENWYKAMNEVNGFKTDVDLETLIFEPAEN